MTTDNHQSGMSERVVIRIINLTPAFIPEVISTAGAASISLGPGAFLTAAGAALGESKPK